MYIKHREKPMVSELVTCGSSDVEPHVEPPAQVILARRLGYQVEWPPKPKVDTLTTVFERK